MRLWMRDDIGMFEKRIAHLKRESEKMKEAEKRRSEGGGHLRVSREMIMAGDEGVSRFFGDDF